MLQKRTCVEPWDGMAVVREIIQIGNIAKKGAKTFGFSPPARKVRVADHIADTQCREEISKKSGANPGADRSWG